MVQESLNLSAPAPINPPIGPGIRILVLGNVTYGEIMKVLDKMRIIRPEIFRDPADVLGINVNVNNPEDVLSYIRSRMNNAWFDLVLFATEDDGNGHTVAYVDFIGILEDRAGIV